MGLWRVSDAGPEVVDRTQLEKSVLEEKLESWIAKDPEILGEPLLVVGRQVLVPDTRDRLDLLAVDPQGAAVIIEIKRGQLKDPAEIQALRYASYISKWKFEDFENAARKYFQEDDGEFSLNDRLEEFALDAGTDEIPNLNEEQRLVLVGASVRDKLGSVALWLREHSVDIKLVEVQAYESDGQFLIQPNVVVPLQVSQFAEVGKPRAEAKPWIGDGRSWHLEQRCSSDTAETLLALDELLQQNLDLDGPRWNQKHYVAYRQNNYNWLSVITSSQTLRLDIRVQSDLFSAEEIAKRLGIETFEKEASFAEKINLPSSVKVSGRTDATDKIQVRLKDDFDLDAPEFLDFLERAYEACPQ